MFSTHVYARTRPALAVREALPSRHPCTVTVPCARQACQHLHLFLPLAVAYYALWRLSHCVSQDVQILADWTRCYKLKGSSRIHHVKSYPLKQIGQVSTPALAKRTKGATPPTREKLLILNKETTQYSTENYSCALHYTASVRLST